MIVKLRVRVKFYVVRTTLGVNEGYRLQLGMAQVELLRLEVDQVGLLKLGQFVVSFI
jgi:hypothetical protein